MGNQQVNFERISQFRFRTRLKTLFQKFIFLVDLVLRQCKNKMLAKGHCSNLSVNVNDVKLTFDWFAYSITCGELLLSYSRPLGIVFLTETFLLLSIFCNLSTLYLLMEEVSRKGYLKTRSRLGVTSSQGVLSAGNFLRWIFGGFSHFEVNDSTEG